MRRLVIVFFLVTTVARGQLWSGFIDSSRAIDWTSVGFTIPNYTVNCATQPTLLTGSANAAANTTAIQNALASCDATHNVVNLPVGTYSVNGWVTDNVNHTVVRGAGSSSTYINLTAEACGGTQAAGVCLESADNTFNGSGSVLPPSGVNQCLWTGGLSKGTTSITLSSCGSAPPLNNILILDQANDATDTGGIYHCDGNQAGCNYQGSLNGNGRVISGVEHSQAQITFITAVTSLGGGSYTVTISPGVYFNNIRAAQSPGAWWFTNAVQNGIENLTLDGTSIADHNIGINNCYQCWVKGVRSINAPHDHIFIFQSSFSVVRDSYFYQTQNHGTTSYGIEFEIGSGILVENNIFQQNTNPILFGAGTGNVIGYNYWVDDVTSNFFSLQTSYYSHNTANSMNLWEGNNGIGIWTDIAWGSSSLGTYYRNILHGYQGGGYSTGFVPINIVTWNRGYNLVGNVLGTPTIQNQYEAFATSGTGGTGSTNAGTSIYETGWANLGGFGTCGTGVSASPFCDAKVHTTLMRWGNYDVITAGTKFDSTEASPAAVQFVNANFTSTYFNTLTHALPASLYYNTKPAWWPAGKNWPPVGPDVTTGNVSTCSGGNFPNILASDVDDCTGTGGTFNNPSTIWASHVTSIPTLDCYLDVMKGPADGSGSVLSFNSTVCYASQSGPALATPIISPNASQTGNSANTLQPPTLAFGSQAIVGGVGTPSTPLSGSINNCSTVNIPACSGTGNLTLGSPVFTVTGTNASDFTVQPGGCTANLIIASGGSCNFTVTFTPSAVAGTNETATLTIAYSGLASSTMSLTGTSSDMTILTSSACPTVMTDGVLYQLGANIVCGGTAFQFASNGYMNMNGFTVTWNNTNQTVQTGAFLGTGFTNKLQLYNGTIQQGVGTNTAVTQPSSTIQAAVTSVNGKNFADGSVFANLTCNYSFQYWNCLNINGPNTTGGNAIIHDVVVNDTALGTCNQPGCRNVLQSTPIVQNGTANNGNSHWYNITVNGSAQGGLASTAPGAIVENNLVFIGSNSGSAGTNSNNFGIYCWGGCTARNNLINIPLQSYSSGRGLQMAGDGGSGSRNVTHNAIQAFSLADSTEYSGCQLGGTYGVQFDDNPQGSSNSFNNNTVNVFSKLCGASGLRVTNSQLTTNTSSNNIYNVSRQAGASVCSEGEQAEPNPGCAFGVSLDGNTSPTVSAFTSTGDTFTADSGEIFIGSSGIPVSSEVFQSPTFLKGSNPSATWHTFWAANGVAASFKVIDATFGPGVSPTDTKIDIQSGTQAATSIFIQWTQKTIVRAANNGKLLVGATVAYKDVLNNTVSCTTDATGSCLVVVTQYRLHNDTAANQIENRNPQTLTVSSTGCTTSTTTGLTINTTTTTTVQLAACGGNVDTALPATFFGFDQTLSGTGHENTGLVYGWQRLWDTPCVWGLIEAVAGTYNFDAQCHSQIQSAVNHNAGVQFVMGRTPASRITGTCTGGYAGTATCAQLASDIDGANTITPAFINAWSTYMNTTWPGVKWRIEGRNEADLANECAENSTIGGHCSMVHLVKEQQTIYNTTKAISATNQVLCPATSTVNHFSVHLYGGTDSASAPFTGAGFAAAGGLAFCDAMNVHPYFFTAGATCNPPTTGSNSGCTPEEAVNGNFTCAATSTTLSGAMGQIACLLAANNQTGMLVESSETNWGKTPPNILFANGGLSDTQRRQWIGRYIMYALNADQSNVTWYTWECPSGNLATCFGTLSGSGVSSAALTALGIMQDWLIGSQITVAAPCTIVGGTTWECAITIHTASGKSGAAEIVFDNGGNTPTISAFGATRAFRLDNTSQTITGNQYTVDGEPTLLFPLAPWTPGPNCRDYQNGSSQNGRSYTNGSTTANGRRCP